jgi:nucleoside-diphosphate-sugar epimerase
MRATKKALILGATGGIGGAVASALLRRGWSVRGMARDPLRTTGAASGGAIQWVTGDAMVRRDVVAAAQGVDTIVHAVNPPGYRNWESTVLPMIDNTIEAAQAVGGARIVLPGTIYNFDPAEVSVIGADTPQNPRSRKGAIRKQLEQRLEGATDVPALIVRAGDFFGPGAKSSWFSQSLVMPKKPVRRLLDPAVSAGHSWAYLPDLADTFARLMMLDDLDTFERVQFEGYVDETGDGILDAIRATLGCHVPRSAFPWWLMRLLAPFGGFPREAAEIEQYWRHPVRLDNTRLVQLLGVEPRTPILAAVGLTLQDLGCLAGRTSAALAHAA